jgi:hypothetical protein
LIPQLLSMMLTALIPPSSFSFSMKLWMSCEDTLPSAPGRSSGFSTPELLKQALGQQHVDLFARSVGRDVAPGKPPRSA